MAQSVGQLKGDVGPSNYNSHTSRKFAVFLESQFKDLLSKNGLVGKVLEESIPSIAPDRVKFLQDNNRQTIR